MINKGTAMNSVLPIVLSAGLLILAGSCKKPVSNPMNTVNGSIPSPVLPETPFNYLGDDEVVTLGRVIFYDKNLSLSSTISCGSCHKQQFAFADNAAFSKGLYNGLTGRNSSAIINSPFHTKFWDGRAGNFDTAVFMPVMNHLEMDVFNLDILPERFSKLPYYADLFEKAFGTAEISIPLIREALASFAENLVSYNSKFDRNELNAKEKAGLEIFSGKGKCYTCHNGNDFNGYSSLYENIGLDLEYPDNGRGNITKNPADYGKFSVPTLRNVALSAPYMHDGRFKTLREVIEHYDSGIKNHDNLSWELVDATELSEAVNALFEQGMTEEQIIELLDKNQDGELSVNEFPGTKPLQLNLTEQEKEALESFLESLTDNAFVTDPKLSNPF